MNERVTQKTVARSLGLSTSTVGLVLGSCRTRSSKKLSPETVSRIEAKALELGYQPHRAAQSVRAGRSNLIGLVHFGGTSEIGSAANRALAQEIGKQGYQHFALDLSWNGHNVEQALRELVQARVEGVVISLITEAFQAEHTALLTRAGIPVISVNGDQRMNVPLVCDDVEGAFARLTRHALEMGHRKLIMLLHDAMHRPNLTRMAGFRRGLEGAGRAEHFSGDQFEARWPALRQEDGVVGAIVQLKMEASQAGFRRSMYDFARRLFSAGMQPDIILPSNDTAAFGIFAAASECGLSIPGDVALTGYGNHDYGSYPAYSLTTIDPCIERSSVAAVRQLVGRIRNEIPAMKSQLFETEIIFRNSSRGRLAPDAPKRPKQPNPPNPR